MVGLPSPFRGKLVLRRRTWRRFVHTARWQLGQTLRRSPWRQAASVLALTALVCLVSYVAPPLAASNPAPGQPTPNPAGVVTTSTDRPSEAKPGPGVYHSTATGAEPKYLRLPTIQAEGYIQKVGVDQHRQIAVPTNIHLAGWFTAAATPGEPGLSIIDGHLDGRTQPGIFAHLAQLKSGDTFTIELGSGATRSFRVKTVQSLPTDQAASALFSQAPDLTSQLNLITCAGVFSNTTKTYDHRVIVTAQYLGAAKRYQ